MISRLMVLSAALLAFVAGAPQYAKGPSLGSLEPYAYQYAIQDSNSGNDFSAEESADGSVISGSYKVALPDGRIQIVTYRVEGDSGFVADVKYEGRATFPAQKKGYVL